MPSNFLASLARHGQPHAPAYSPATGNGAQAALAAAGRSALTTRAALLAFMIGLAAMFAAQDFPRHWADSASYISMAQGLPALMPWAARILLPDIVAFLSMTLGVGMDHAFEVMTCLAFIVWISTVAEEWRPSAWLPLFLVTPLVVASLQAVYITDMFHMGLTALFFLLLRRNIFLAAGFMVILVLCRESSMFLAFVSAGFLLWNRNWLGAVAMLAGYFVGSAIVHHATAGVQNVHHMPELMYLVTKIPANFLRDWVGVLLWTNGYAWCDQPVFSVVLPGGMHLGAITQIGFCAPSIAAPLSTASAYVTIFGVLPAVLIAVLKTQGVPAGKWREEWWATAFVYGVVMVVLGPLAGAPVDREIGFGWPLLFIALPAICTRMMAWRIAVLHVLAAWSPLLLNGLLAAPGSELSFIGIAASTAVAGPSLLIGVAANVAAYKVMRSALAPVAATEMSGSAHLKALS